MRKILSFTLIVIVLALGILSCASPAPTPTPAPAPTTSAPAPSPTPKPTATTPAATPTPTTAVQPITLKFATWYPSTGLATDCVLWYLNEVEKRANGKVKFERFWSGSLAPAGKELDAINKGIADIASINNENSPAEIPLSTVMSLPVIMPDMWPGLTASIDLFEMAPLKAELAKYKAKFIAPIGTGPFEILTKKPINTLNDLKGQRLRAQELQAVVVQAFGAVPVTMTPTEMYTQLQRGTIDGVVHTIPGVSTYKLYEVAKYFTYIGLGAKAGTFFVINQDAWAKLPADVQKIMLDVGKEAPTAFHRIYQLEGSRNILEKVFPDNGVKVSDLPAADRALIQASGGRTVWDDWAWRMEGKGLPGRDILQAFITLHDKYAPLSPFKK